MAADKDRIAALLERLEELRKRGLIDEVEYKEKRNQLLSMYLGLEPSGTKYGQRPVHKERRLLLITLLVIGVIMIGVVASYYIKFIQFPIQTATMTINLIQPTTVFSTEYITQTRTVMPTAVYPNVTPTTIWKSYNERIIYDGRLYLEKDCHAEIFQIDARKGDLIRVIWESDDDDTYVAIGTDADFQRVKGYYCEVLVILWRSNWPAADYGYSGSLEFTVPSSGTWKVLILNGNWGCVTSNCPITVTQLRIIHIEK